MRRRSKRLDQLTIPVTATLQRSGIQALVVNVSRPDEVDEAQPILPDAVIAIGRHSLLEVPASRELLDQLLLRQTADRIWVVQWRDDFTKDQVPKPLLDRVFPPLGQPPLYSLFQNERELEQFTSWLASDITASLTGDPSDEPPPDPQRSPLSSDDLLDLCYGLVFRGQCDAVLLTEFRAETLRPGLKHYGPGTLAEQAHRASRQLGTGLLERADPVWLAWVRHLKMDLVEELGSRLERTE